MDNDQITALAREYAESRYPEAKTDEDDFLYDSAVYVMEDNLRWLLSRYCLVEKSKVTTEYKACASMRDDNLLPNIESAIQHHKGIEGIRVLKSLFPEIAKEVEL